MIQLEIQMLETEIQTAKDYGLKDGERADKLEQFKDSLEKVADTVGLTPVLTATKEAAASAYNGVTRGITQPGVRKNG
jgi:hypothetical protein